MAEDKNRSIRQWLITTEVTRKKTSPKPAFKMQPTLKFRLNSSNVFPIYSVKPSQTQFFLLRPFTGPWSTSSMVLSFLFLPTVVLGLPTTTPIISHMKGMGKIGSHYSLINQELSGQYFLPPAPPLHPSAKDQNQGLKLTRQILYQLSYVSGP